MRGSPDGPTATASQPATSPKSEMKRHVSQGTCVLITLINFCIIYAYLSFIMTKVQSGIGSRSRLPSINCVLIFGTYQRCNEWKFRCYSAHQHWLPSIGGATSRHFPQGPIISESYSYLCHEHTTFTRGRWYRYFF